MQGLPQLSGPDERLAEVIAFHADCMREFSGSGLSVRAVDLSARGSWRLTLASGALIEIGRVDATPAPAEVSRCLAEARSGQQRSTGLCRPALRKRIRDALGPARSAGFLPVTRSRTGRPSLSNDESKV